MNRGEHIMGTALPLEPGNLKISNTSSGKSVFCTDISIEKNDNPLILQNVYTRLHSN